MIQLFIFIISWITYNWVIYARYGLLDSVSASHYALVNESKKLGWIFTVFTWSYAIPAAMLSHSIMMFAACGFISFVGVAANYRTNPSDQIFHGKFAKLAVVLSQLSIIFEYNLWYISLISVALIAIIYLTKVKNSTYWIEQVAFFTITYVFILELIK